ncbi:MAG: GerAB/ArcD/ProY family transporter [Clostridia bacterium]|nr:GerAB/ArcD/ProY family transporter [Clostridia bacterium]
MNNLITKRQLGLIVFFIPFVFKFSILPSILSKIAHRDIWITMFFIMLIELIQLALIIKVDNLGGLDEIKRSYGKTVYTLLTVPLFAVMVLKGAVYLSETNSYSNSYLFYNISTRGVVVVVVIIASYVAVKGAKGIGRLVEQVIWLIPIAIIIGLLFGKLKLTPSYLLPIGVDGIAPIAKSLDKCFYWAMDFTPFLFLKIRDESKLPPRKRSRFPWIPACAVGSLLLMTALYALYVMNYGGGGHLVDTAFSSLGAFNVVNTEIGSIDWPSITLWLSVAVISLALKIFGSSKVISSFGLKFPVAVLIVGVLISSIAQFGFYNLERAVKFATGYARYAIIAIELIVPIIILILIERKKFSKEIVNNETTI